MKATSDLEYKAPMNKEIEIENLESAFTNNSQLMLNIILISGSNLMSLSKAIILHKNES
jgi:hypothetical protein